MRFFLAAILAMLVVAYLAGCATIQRHPVATAVVVGIVAGSIAASASDRADIGVQPSICNTKPESCR